jgi:hypothetical protein
MKQESGPRKKRLLAVVAVAAIGIFAVTALGFYLVYSPSTTTEFRVQVVYRGSWQESWTTYQGGPPAQIATGHLGGTGKDSTMVSDKTSSNNYARYSTYICAQVNSLDNSRAPLNIGLYLNTTRLDINSTSLPIGSTVVCGGLYP